MCTANTYSESAMKGLTIQSDGPNPCGRWIRNAIQSITEQQMLLGLSDGIDSTVSHLKKLGMFRKPVKSPVWFVIKDDLVYVVTREQMGKVKRLKNNLQVKFALCTMKGKVTGDWVSGTAKILTDEQTKEAVKMRDKKYGFMARNCKICE